MKLPLSMLLVVACSGATAEHADVELAGAESAVEVSVSPRQVYIEETDAGQQLNFDFILKNRTGDELIINKVELSILDSAGKLVRREFYDEYGRKSLELAATPTIDERSTVLFYNPFHTFTAGLPLNRLHYEFSFSTENRSKYFRSEIDVAPVSYQSKTDLIVPLRGRVLVWDGHDYYSHHRRTNYLLPFMADVGYKANFQRFGYDFVIVDERGEIHKGPSRVNDDWYYARPDRMDDYYSFGVPIHATGAGRILLVKDTRPDDRTFNRDDLKIDEHAMAGNYVVIDHLNGEFSWFGHIKQGSARVKVGQMVQQGDTIAAVGAAGSSLFPHLHYELRDAASSMTAEGLPSYFSNFRRLVGSRPVKVERGAINTGDLVDW
jgi:hypothetical protein